MITEKIERVVPVTVLDNFFEDPDSVRNFALSQNFSPSPGHYPGFRSQRLDKIDESFERSFTEKVFSLFFDLNCHDITWSVESSFQLIPSKFEEGWVHSDNSPDGWNVAGLVYLNPQPSPNSGTSICSRITDTDYSSLDLKKFTQIKHKFYRGEPVDPELYRNYRNELNSKFSTTINVENVYNRLVVYSADELHKANNFFGEHKEDSRLTLMFYARVEPNNTTFTTSR
jgi:hypothetical protein